MSVGFFLLAWFILFLVFSEHVFGDLAINLLAITAMVICICLHRVVMAGVYEHKYLNIIEYSFLVNDFSRHCFCYTYSCHNLLPSSFAIKGSQTLKQIREKLFHREEHPSRDQWNDEHPHIEDHKALPINRRTYSLSLLTSMNYVNP